MNRTHAIGLAVTAGAFLGAIGLLTLGNRFDTLTRVVDGDTLVINGGTHVRLWGIDAPELGQTCKRPDANFAYDCGAVSKDYLASFFRWPNIKLTCESRGTDSYKRTLAVCYTINPAGHKHDIGRSLVAAGMAVDYTEFSNGAYRSQQDYAKRHKLGVWATAFDMPWDHRKAPRR